ncbi:hypothetical protein [Streptomyces venezuelae]|uniref:hypothetical protein n=1 Tax=Streptomyces venezuelae TaxID=54571 RepID=UPI00123C27CB|nr:hypothetical protein [Streptomyces venezuelae]
MLYAEKDVCGLLVVSDGDPARDILHIRTAWPEKGEGTTEIPHGPYLKSSGSGSHGSKIWASLSCAKDAMVVNYSDPSLQGKVRHRGAVSVASKSAGKQELAMVAAPDDKRARILSSVTSRQP